MSVEYNADKTKFRNPVTGRMIKIGAQSHEELCRGIRDGLFKQVADKIAPCPELKKRGRKVGFRFGKKEEEQKKAPMKIKMKVEKKKKKPIKIKVVKSKSQKKKETSRSKATARAQEVATVQRSRRLLHQDVEALEVNPALQSASAGMAGDRFKVSGARPKKQTVPKKPKVSRQRKDLAQQAALGGIGYHLKQSRKLGLAREVRQFGREGQLMQKQLKSIPTSEIIKTQFYKSPASRETFKQEKFKKQPKEPWYPRLDRPWNLQEGDFLEGYGSEKEGRRFFGKRKKKKGKTPVNFIDDMSVV